jgi:uncharacterized protein involved in copper resistance
MKKYQAVNVGVDGLKAYWFNFDADTITQGERGNYAYDSEHEFVAYVPYEMVIRPRLDEE